jgi:hypothetical protein
MRASLSDANLFAHRQSVCGHDELIRATGIMRHSALGASFGIPELNQSECRNSAFTVSNTYSSLYFVKEDLSVSDFPGCSILLQ